MDDQAARYEHLIAAAIAAHERMRRRDPAPLVAAAAAIVKAVTSGGKVLVFGNGGSAADAQHAAAELVGRFERDRPAIAAIALSTDTSILTAVGNDFGFERVFARQIEALGRPGDAVLAISTSGDSPNVLAGVDAARRTGLTVIALTGRDGGTLGRAADIHVNVPEHNTARAQEVHRTLLHILCELVEQEVFGL
ncbi:MAG: D-sedoheptulose-7-phosphate isomerase [Vicinamibacterales bacterium]